MFSTKMECAILKALAVRAIHDLRRHDPHNLWVQDKEKVILMASTLGELNEAVNFDEGGPEENWIEAFVQERSEELVGELLLGGAV